MDALYTIYFRSLFPMYTWSILLLRGTRAFGSWRHLVGLKGTMIVSPLPARCHQCPRNKMVEHGAYCHKLLILSTHSHTSPSIWLLNLIILLFGAHCKSKVARRGMLHSVHSIFLPLYICQGNQWHLSVNKKSQIIIIIHVFNNKRNWLFNLANLLLEPTILAFIILIV